MIAQKEKITVKRPEPEQLREMPTQIRRHEVGQFRLQVDRQTKASYDTLDAAKTAGLAIKRGYPHVVVSVYDSKEGANTTIDL